MIYVYKYITISLFHVLITCFFKTKILKKKNLNFAMAMPSPIVKPLCPLDIAYWKLRCFLI